MYEWTLISY